MRNQTETPQILTSFIKNTQRLVGMNETAEALSFSLGQTVADIRSQHPSIDIMDDDPLADTNLLETIADWADRYTPLIAFDRSSQLFKQDHLIPRIFKHGLYFDITGCAHLFSRQANPGETPEEALVRDIKTRLINQGFYIHTGLASTVGAAWALSRFHDNAIIAPGTEKEVLQNLPLTALRIDPAVEDAMNRVGLKRIYQIATMPRAPLASRFGINLIRRLDQAFGEEDESISPRITPPDLMAERRFNEPISQTDDIEQIIGSLAETLSLTLETRGEGARTLEVCLFHSDGEVTRTAITTSKGVRTSDTVRHLFSTKLDETLTRFQARIGEAATGFDVIRLSILSTDKITAIQERFDGGNKTQISSDLAHLIDQLGARFGPENIRQLMPADSHRPETAQTLTPIIKPASDKITWPEHPLNQPVTRPIRLFERPEQVEAIAGIPEGPPLRFRWRRILYNIARVEGPERISANWWEQEKYPDSSASHAAAAQFTRDYYRVEDINGHRFWLYRDGLYNTQTNQPNWYLHGLFA